MLRPLLFSLVLAASARPASIREVQPHRTDVNHSSVGFSVPILGGISQVTGKFSRFKLDFDFDEEKPENSKVLATIDATSVDTGIDDRDAHMQSDDFFATSEHPEIVYESFEVRVLEKDHLEVVGVLTIRDISKDVSLDVRVLREKDGDSVGFVGTTQFDRQPFGVKYRHGDIPDFIGDEVNVNLHVLTRPSKRR